MEIKLNLLSEAKKKEIRRRRRYRFVVWQEMIVVSIIVFYIGILFGIHSMLRLQLSNQESVDAAERQQQAFREIDSAAKQFQEVNGKVSNVLKFQREHIVWSNFFIALDRSIPEGIALYKISTVEKKISLSGKADTRDILLSFQEAVNRSDCFSDAQVPLADLFDQENVEFQMDITMKQECLKPGNL